MNQPELPFGAQETAAIPPEIKDVLKALGYRRRPVQTVHLPGDGMGESKNICSVCGQEIKMMIFKGTGVCCENHRKLRDNEPDRPAQNAF